MKRFLLFLIVALVGVGIKAQKEVDFADKFMKLYAKGTTLKCQTVSPMMVQRILQNEDAVKDKDIEEALSMIRTVRIVFNQRKSEAENLYKKAQSLLEANKNRYQLFDEYEKKTIYTRKKGKKFVEVILFDKSGKSFQMVNVTGSIPVSYISKWMKKS